MVSGIQFSDYYPSLYLDLAFHVGNLTKGNITYADLMKMTVKELGEIENIKIPMWKKLIDGKD